ncbi:MAG: hypothetical protein ABSF43_16640 [Rectinemataceae bacterium]|jgi:hypothetical protein
MPPTTLLAPPWHFYDEFLSRIEGAELNVKKYWEGGSWVERRTYSTPVGTVWQEIAKDGGGVGSENIRRHYLQTKEDYRTMEYMVEHTVFSSNTSRIESRLRELGEDGVLLARLDRSPYQKCLIELAGPERFLLDFFDDPAPALDLMAAMQLKMDEAFEMALASPLEILWQPDNVTCEMTPPDIFEAHLLPLYRRRSAAAEAAGKRYLVHMDGKLKALARHIAAAGIHAVESFTLPDMGGDLSLAEARSLFPKAIPHPSVPSNWFVLPDAELEERAAALAGELRGYSSMLQVSEDIPPSSLDRVLDCVLRFFPGTV